MEGIRQIKPQAMGLSPLCLNNKRHLAIPRLRRLERPPWQGDSLFVYPHGMLDPWLKRTYPRKHIKKWAYWLWADYRVLRDAKAVLFTSEQERLLARQTFWMYRAQEQVVGYGTSAPLADAARQRPIFWQHFPQLRGQRILLFLSRIHPPKRVRPAHRGLRSSGPYRSAAPAGDCRA
jgi:hypothetical protein